ncbi:hypothetical protein THAOC_01229 [Thalassiosira oceanica]|uniref:Uncharacterized protein n=1 Tax=Thalassiosira oceanica TaxID=159749 RepID=K0TIS0_THAOC|nr:hypothetical protein THAOC_01229 [Thalassiosira oceanica]|eukprot:EJK76974.1 hypothetical protein THAOC_01229 [Thalassiosira oceanica]
MIPTETTSLMFSPSTGEAGEESFASNKDTVAKKGIGHIQTALAKRRESLSEQGVGKAAFLIKDAVIGMRDAPYEGYYDPYEHGEGSLRDYLSVAAGRLVVQLRWITVLACWALFLLGFVEPPSWCREASNLNIIANQLTVSNKDEYGDCDVLLHATGTTIDGQENRELYPSTKSMILTYRESKHIEIFGLCVVSFFMLLKLADDGFRLNLFFYSGKKRRLNTLQLAVLAGLSFCTAIDAVEPKPILRMLLLASFLRGFQKEFFTVVQMIPQMSAPLSILAIIILFYGWFGTGAYI